MTVALTCQWSDLTSTPRASDMTRKTVPACTRGVLSYPSERRGTVLIGITGGDPVQL